jgi:hypothetical protein
MVAGIVTGGIFLIGLGAAWWWFFKVLAPLNAPISPPKSRGINQSMTMMNGRLRPMHNNSNLMTPRALPQPGNYQQHQQQRYYPPTNQPQYQHQQYPQQHYSYYPSISYDGAQTALEQTRTGALRI